MSLERTFSCHDLSASQAEQVVQDVEADAAGEESTCSEVSSGVPGDLLASAPASGRASPDPTDPAAEDGDRTPRAQRSEPVDEGAPKKSGSPARPVDDTYPLSQPNDKAFTEEETADIVKFQREYVPDLSVADFCEALDDREGFVYHHGEAGHPRVNVEARRIPAWERPTPDLLDRAVGKIAALYPNLGAKFLQEERLRLEEGRNLVAVSLPHPAWVITQWGTSGDMRHRMITDLLGGHFVKEYALGNIPVADLGAVLAVYGRIGKMAAACAAQK